MPAGPPADRPSGRGWWPLRFLGELVTGGWEIYAVHVHAGQASGAVESGPCDRGASVVRTAAGIDQSGPRCSCLPYIHHVVHVVAERTTSLVGLFVVSQTRVLRRTVS